MCQTAVYVIKNDQEELVSDDIAYIRPAGDKVEFIDFNGGKRVIDAKVKEINLLRNKVILTSNA